MPNLHRPTRLDLTRLDSTVELSRVGVGGVNRALASDERHNTAHQTPSLGGDGNCVNWGRGWIIHSLQSLLST